MLPLMAGLASCQPKTAALDAARWAKAGFQSLKIKIGGDVDADIQRVQAVRAAVGKVVNLRMDANEQYSVQDAIRLCDAIKDCDMQLFEQPVPRDDLAGLAEITACWRDQCYGR